MKDPEKYVCLLCGPDTKPRAFNKCGMHLAKDHFKTTEDTKDFLCVKIGNCIGMHRQVKAKMLHGVLKRALPPDQQALHIIIHLLIYCKAYRSEPGDGVVVGQGRWK